MDVMFSADLAEVWPLESRMLPAPVGEGNWASLKSEDADSILAWRSSKLTEGRKSYELEDWRAASPFRLKEKCDWLAEALSIGAFVTGFMAVAEVDKDILEADWGSLVGEDSTPRDPAVRLPLKVIEPTAGSRRI